MGHRPSCVPVVLRYTIYTIPQRTERASDVRHIPCSDRRPQCQAPPLALRSGASSRCVAPPVSSMAYL
eukprot:2580739-Prymnesium_polylepis.1